MTSISSCKHKELSYIPNTTTAPEGSTSAAAASIADLPLPDDHGRHGRRMVRAVLTLSENESVAPTSLLYYLLRLRIYLAVVSRGNTFFEFNLIMEDDCVCDYDSTWDTESDDGDDPPAGESQTRRSSQDKNKSSWGIVRIFLFVG